MRVALFVEGSQSPPGPRQVDPFQRIWKEHLPGLAGCDAFSSVYPISKVNIVQLDPAAPRASGNAEPIDARIARALRDGPAFDAAVVAWDLEPPLAGLEPPRCRWQETLFLYRHLAVSTHLDADWRGKAAERLADYQARGDVPSARRNPPKIARFEIRPLCMEPEFEDMLLVAPDKLRPVLGVSGRPARGWPRDWTPTPSRRGKSILHEAIEAARRTNAPGFPPIRGTIQRTAPNEWGEWILRELIDDEATRAKLRTHPVPGRLRELLV